ncbi:MAG TPA: glycerophosphodiester phosphodiesterase, partial [Acidobacteriota bacterium]|nr:glycerophosphodiester phosphodiesterase [Acidobacteriota bacterium]
MIFEKNPHFWVLAHRGFSGMYPENTMPAFEAAAKLPIDCIELDIHCSRDGKLVVIHDETLERTTDLTGRILDHDWDELRRADAGYHFDPAGKREFPFREKGIGIPLLEDVVTRFPETKFVIEIKQSMPAIEELLYRLIRKHRMEERVIVASAHQEPLRRMRDLSPYVATSFSGAEAGIFYHMFRFRFSNFYQPPGDALQIPPRYDRTRVVTPGF